MHGGELELTFVTCYLYEDKVSVCYEMTKNITKARIVFKLLVLV